MPTTAPPASRRAPSRDDQRFSLIFAFLPQQFAQVVQLRAAHVATRDDVDVVDVRGVHGERPLDAHAVALLAHGEGLADAAALAAQHHALEDLDAFLGALDDL